MSHVIYDPNAEPGGFIKDARPPPSVPERDSDNQTSFRRIGVAIEDDLPFVISQKHRKAHTHIIGGTRRGKSVFMERQIMADIDANDCGLCLIDPHNKSTFDNLLNHISRYRPDLAKRVVVFNPSQDIDGLDTVVGFNPLGNYARVNPRYALNMIVSVCLKVWGQYSSDQSPRIVRWLENIFYLILSNRLTFLEAAALLSTEKHNPFLNILLDSVKNHFIETDWNDFMESTRTQKQNILEGASNRLRKFLRNEYVRLVMGQQENILDIDRIIDEKKILLCKLPEGTEIERDSNQMVGIMLVNEIFRSAMCRRNPENSPHPFFLYIDEFAQYATREIAYLIEEAGKHQLYLTIAHQHLAQLQKNDEYLYASVMGNCHNRVVFGGLSCDDAEILTREINTGYEDWHEIKHRHEHTYFRPVQEWQARYGFSEGENVGFSNAFSVAYGKNLSVGKSLAKSLTEGMTLTDGVTKQTARGGGSSKGGATASQNSKSSDEGASRGKNWNESHTEGESENESDSIGHTDSKNRQEGKNESSSTSGSVRMNNDGLIDSNRGSGEQRGTSSMEGSGSSDSNSKTKGSGKSRSDQSGHGGNIAVTQRRGEGSSVTDTKNESNQISFSESLARQHSKAVSTTKGQTETDSVSEGLSEQYGKTDTESFGNSRTVNVGYAPGVRHEEEKEYRDEFYSLPDITHRFTGEIMKQRVGVAMVVVDRGKPVQVKIDYTEPLPVSSYTRKHVNTFCQAVFRESPRYCLPVEKAEREIKNRQMGVFDQVLEFGFDGEVVVEEIPPDLPDLPPLPAPEKDPVPNPDPQTSYFGDDD